MLLFILLVTIIAFVLFFYGVGLRYLGFLPFVFLLTILIYYTSTHSFKDNNYNLLEKHGMLFARILLLGGLAGVGHFLGLQLFSIAQIFVAFNL